MANLLMITFRCRRDLFERLEQFAIERNIDRTSAIKLALHYYLNLRESSLTRRPSSPPVPRQETQSPR